VSPYPTETLELDAQDREGLVLDVALPVLGAWGKSVRVVGFRPSMGVSGLSPREAARLRTLGLGTASRGTGIFEGANDFRLSFPTQTAAAALASPALGVDADLGGHPIAPVVSDLTIASFGLPVGKSLTHRLQGFTHVRAASAQGYGARTLQSLASEFGLDLEVTTEALGFEPQGLGRVSIAASRTSRPGRAVDWKSRGEFKSVHATIGAVRPKQEQMDRLEAELREALWEARRIEPVMQRVITPGVDLGSFLQIDVECERGGATFMDIIGRSAAALSMARRAVKRTFGFLDSDATCDELTGIAALSAAIGARGDLEISLPPSDRLAGALALLREIGVSIEEQETRGLIRLRTTAP
jgi:RNA 3'-terminal phosphate cyclase